MRLFDERKNLSGTRQFCAASDPKSSRSTDAVVFRGNIAIIINSVMRYIDFDI